MMIQVLVGIIIANLFEWVIHKYILHGRGKKKNSMYSSHWNMHHRKARHNDYYDEDYERFFSGWNEGQKEVLGIILLTVVQIPTFFYLPYYAATTIAMGVLYFMLHRHSHLNPKWARRWLPWHYDHHMGKNQDANWCVTFPLWDHILGTRVKHSN